MQRNRVIEAASSAEALPTLPSVILQGARAALTGDPRAEKFIPIVEVDPALTIRVMKAVHESTGGDPFLIRHPAEAVRALGLEAVRRIVLGTPALEVFMDHRGSYGLDPVDLWIHSLGTAIYARELAKSVETVDPQEAYLAGLLHDVGKFILAGCCRDVYPAVVQQARQGNLPLHNTESGRLGYHHAEMGAWLTEPWRLHPLFAQTILHHHHPVEGTLSEKPQFLLTGLVALANNLCYGQNLGSGGDPARATLPPNVFTNLGIPRETIKQAIREAPLYFKEAMARIDWEPVCRASFRALLDKAKRPPVDRQEECEPAVSLSAAPTGFQDLQGINAIGLSLLKCDSLETAEGNRVRQEEILECLPLGLVLIDAEGNVGFANREARRLLGPRKTLVGVPLRELVELEGLVQAWETCLQGVGTSYREIGAGRLETPAGKRLRWKLVPLRDGSRSVERVLLLLDEHASSKTSPEPVLSAGAELSPERTRSGTA